MSRDGSVHLKKRNAPFEALPVLVANPRKTVAATLRALEEKRIIRTVAFAW